MSRKELKALARRKRYKTQINRYGLDGRQGKFDLLLKGKLRLKKAFELEANTTVQWLP